MTDIDYFKELLKEDTFEVHKGSIILEEKRENAKVKIKDVPEDSILIKYENHWHLDKIFRNNKHECRKADYILVSRHQNKTYLLFIELKASSDSENHIKGQLAGAECFINYCKCIIRQKIFWGSKGFLAKSERRFLGFINTRVSMNKRPTRHLISGSKHDTPECFARIGVGKASLSFRKLIGNIDQT